VCGITGALDPHYIYPIIIRVGGWPHKIKAGFLPGIAKMGYGVLGQVGFFDLFVVKFDYKKEKIELKEKK